MHSIYFETIEVSAEKLFIILILQKLTKIQQVLRHKIKRRIEEPIIKNCIAAKKMYRH